MIPRPTTPRAVVFTVPALADTRWRTLADVDLAATSVVEPALALEGTP